jgi:hypothetical protein
LYAGLAGHPAPASSQLAFSETWERRMVGPFADAGNAEKTLHAIALSTAHGAFQTADVLKVSERFEPDLKALMDALHAWSHPGATVATRPRNQTRTARQRSPDRMVDRAPPLHPDGPDARPRAVPPRRVGVRGEAMKGANPRADLITSPSNRSRPLRSSVVC